MKRYIIKTSGKMSDVIQQIKTLQAIFGDGATLSDIATYTQYIKLDQIVKNQFEKDDYTK